jgi:hypothetical protein
MFSTVCAVGERCGPAPEVAFLAMTSSPAFVAEPEGNGCAERFIRTLKENLLWVRSFRRIKDLRQALLRFREMHKHHWLIERLGYRTAHVAREALGRERHHAA